MTAVNGSLTIGIIGHKGSGDTLCWVLGDVFRTARLCRNTVFTPNTEIFCVSDTARVHLIDIAVGKWKRRHAVRDISHCDVIIYIISAVESDNELSNEDTTRMMRRYLQIEHVFGVKHFIIAMNKMDSPSVSYSEQIFDEMKERIKEIVDKTNVDDYCIVPIGLRCKRNISAKSESMKWYDGPTLKEIIDDIKPKRNVNGPALLSVSSDPQSWWSNNGHCYVHDIIIGKKICGKLSVGDNIKIFPSGKKAKIQSIGRHQERVNEAFCGDIVRIELDEAFCGNIEKGNLIQFDDYSVGGNTFQNVVRFSAIIHIQRWSEENQKRVTEFITASDPNRKRRHQCEFTMLIRGVRVQCSIRSIEWKINPGHKAARFARFPYNLVSEKAFKDPAQSLPSSFQPGDTAKVVLDVISPICMSPFKRNRKLGSFIITGPGSVMTHFGFGKVVDILFSENDLVIRGDFAISKVDYRERAVTYCNYIERNLSINMSIAEEVIQVIGAYCGPKIVYQRGGWKDSWEVFSEAEGKDIVKMVNDGYWYLFLGRNGTLWRDYGDWCSKHSSTLVEIEYFAKRGIKVKDIAVANECYVVDCEGNTYRVAWKGDKYDNPTCAPSTVELDHAEYQRIFLSSD